MQVSHWISWIGGVDLFARTPESDTPNVLIHVAERVTTPYGKSPAGMINLALEPNEPPLVAGFLAEDKVVGGYFGPNIFSGTPFEAAPVHGGVIQITRADGAVSAWIEVHRHLIELRMSHLGPAELVSRAPTEMTPFVQQGIEHVAGRIDLVIDGRKIDLIVPEVGITGGPAAVYAPCGIYAR